MPLRHNYRTAQANKVLELFRQLWWSGQAVTSIEYALIASLIIFALVVSVPGIAPSLSHIFNQVSQAL